MEISIQYMYWLTIFLFDGDVRHNAGVRMTNDSKKYEEHMIQIFIIYKRKTVLKQILDEKALVFK
jgi:hypothetical protein